MPIIWGSATGPNGDRVNVWIDWTETSIDINNNRSYVVADFYAQTKPDKTSSTYDGQGKSWFYVNGNQVDYRYGLIDFRSPARPLNHLGHWESWVQHDSDGKASITLAGNFDISSSYIRDGSASGTVQLTEIWTAATPPSSRSFSASIYENSITMFWSGQASGKNNAITGYHVLYRTNDGSGWSGETTVNVGGATSLNINTASWPRGRQLKFRVRCLTVKGDNPISGESAVATKNRAPGTPGKPTPNSSIYKVGDTITLTFSAAIDADGNLSGYEAKMQDASGADYNGGAIIGTSSGTTLAINTAGWAPGKKWRFLVRAKDSFGVRGSWSAASDYIQIGVAMKAVIDGGIKNLADCYIVVESGGTKSLKPIAEAYEVTIGGIKALA